MGALKRNELAYILYKLVLYVSTYKAHLWI